MRSTCTALALAALLSAGPSFAQSKPNIVVVMADDLDMASFNALMGAGMMPNAAALKSAGVQFDSSFSSNPICGPSRSTFLTGQHSHNNGVLTNYGSTGGIKAFLSRYESSNLATWMQKAGYRTCHVGKFINGYGAGALLGTTPGYVPPGWTDWHGLVDNSTYRVWGFEINHNGSLQTYPAQKQDPDGRFYQTDVLSRIATRFIEDSEVYETTPFFMVVTPLAPHVEIDEGGLGWDDTIRPAPRHVGTTDLLPFPPSTSTFNEADVSDKPAWVQALPSLTQADIDLVTKQYHERTAALRAVDDLLGSVVSKLQSCGERANTVIVFTSDNGWFYGEHRLSQKGPGYEESIRVPLIVSGPGITGGRSVTPYAVNIDLAPTILAFAGGQPDAGVAMDGRSLTPILYGQADSYRKRFLYEFWSGQAAQIPQCSGVRTSALDESTPRRTYIELATGESELYRLASDPVQETDLTAGTDPSVPAEVSALSAWVAQLEGAAGANVRTLEDQ